MGIFIEENNNSGTSINKYNIDKRKISIRDVEGSMQYLSSCGVPEDKLQSVRSYLEYEKSKIQSDIDNYNLVVKNRPDVDSYYKLKRTLDNGTDYNVELNYKENTNTKYDRKNNRILNQFNGIINDAFPEVNGERDCFFINTNNVDRTFNQLQQVGFTQDDFEFKNNAIGLKYDSRYKIKQFVDNTFGADTSSFFGKLMAHQLRVNVFSLIDKNLNTYRIATRLTDLYNKLDRKVYKAENETFSEEALVSGTNFPSITPSQASKQQAIDFYSNFGSGSKEEEQYIGNLKKDVQTIVDRFSDYISNSVNLTEIETFKLDDKKNQYIALDSSERNDLNNDLKLMLNNPDLKGNVKWSSYYDPVSGKILAKATVVNKDKKLIGKDKPNYYLFDFTNDSELSRFNECSGVKAMSIVNDITRNLGKKTNVTIAKSNGRFSPYQIYCNPNGEYILTNNEKDIARLDRFEAIKLVDFYYDCFNKLDGGIFDGNSTEDNAKLISTIASQYQNLWESILGKDRCLFGVKESYEGAKNTSDIYTEIIANMMGFSIYPNKTKSN